MIRWTWALVGLFGCSAPASTVEPCVSEPSPHPRAAEWGAALAAAQRDQALPGLALAVRDADGTWVGAAGTADAGAQVPLASCAVFPIFSVTKTFVAATVLSLVEDGTLGLDDRARDYLTDAEAEGLANIDTVTIAQLVGQRSGVPDYVDTPFVLATLDAPERRWTWRQALDRVRGAAAQFAPGESFRYSNTNFLLAAAVIEGATGEPHDAVVTERVLAPLAGPSTYRADDFDTTGLVRGYFDLYGNGSLIDTTDTIALAEVGPDGGIRSDAAGVAAFFDALFRDEALVGAPALDEMRQWSDPTTDPEWAAAPGLAEMDGYGLGLIRWEVDGVEGWGHNGDGFGYQSLAYTFPEADTTFVLLANGSSFVAEPDNLSGRFEAARDALVRAALSR